MIYEAKFLVALGITSILEVIPGVLILWILGWKKLDAWWEWGRTLFVLFLASFATLPYLWFVISPFVNARYYVFVGEGMVFLFEAMIYFVLLKLRIWQAVVLSLVLNLISYFVGGNLVSYFLF